VSLPVLALSLPLAIALILIGFAKVQQLPASMEIAVRLTIKPTVWRWWGMLDLACAAALIVGSFAVPTVAFVAAVATVMTMLGLVFVQMRHQEPVAFRVPAVALALLAAADAVVLTRT